MPRTFFVETAPYGERNGDAVGCSWGWGGGGAAGNDQDVVFAQERSERPDLGDGIDSIARKGGDIKLDRKENYSHLSFSFDGDAFGLMFMVDLCGSCDVQSPHAALSTHNHSIELKNKHLKLRDSQHTGVVRVIIILHHYHFLIDCCFLLASLDPNFDAHPEFNSSTFAKEPVIAAVDA